MAERGLGVYGVYGQGVMVLGYRGFRGLGSSRKPSYVCLGLPQTPALKGNSPRESLVDKAEELPLGDAPALRRHLAMGVHVSIDPGP